ncbi:MAG: PfkB family carbohydrate kinase [Kiritimatiellia bacterium]
MPEKAVDIIVVGSVGIDTVETPYARREAILGGSASYACMASALFARTGMVGIVGADFPEEYRKLYQGAGIDLEGLQTVKGDTFRWEGKYEPNMDHRRTLAIALNVFQDFKPELPATYANAPYIFLGNISPQLQMHVLDQVKKPKFVMADTMDLWIQTTPEELKKLISRVDMLTLNEHEARALTGGRYSLIRAGRDLLELGPQYVMIKKGEHGSLLISRDNLFVLPAFPLEKVVDPTGAGDTFAGAFLGALARFGKITEKNLRKAMRCGAVVASIGIEAFSLDALKHLTLDEVEKRISTFREYTAID